MNLNPVPARGLDLDISDFAGLVDPLKYELLSKFLRRLNGWSDDIVDYLGAVDVERRRLQQSLASQGVASGYITTNGAGGATIESGENLEAAYPSGGNLVVNMTVEMDSDRYPVLALARNGGGVIPSPLPLGFTTRRFVLDFDSDTGSDVNPATTALQIWCVVFGKRKGA